MFAAVVRFEGGPVAGLGPTRDVLAIRSEPPHVAFVRAAAEGDQETSAIETLEGRYWIVGRIRLDARDELRRRLSQSDGGDHHRDSDALLCLHAYAAWREGFVSHLAGDFCFVLWDDAHRRLLCVRDRLGVR